jgi:glyoxylase-like metal-dependent hydrolase (beta-lactamase superfamily II)
MRTLAPDVHQLRGLPPNVINAYVVGDVLVDSGTPLARWRVLRQVRRVPIAAHVVTHAHPDHFGSTHEVCEALGIPLWTGERDAAALETGRPEPGEGRVAEMMFKAKMPPGHPVDRQLREGDEVAGFTVLDAPGHSPGHIALWRESDRTLICGDVFFHVRGVTAPPGLLTTDPERNRASMRRLAELRPALVLFGHGPPSRDPEALLRAAG